MKFVNTTAKDPRKTEYFEIFCFIISEDWYLKKEKNVFIELPKLNYMGPSLQIASTKAVKKYIYNIAILFINFRCNPYLWWFNIIIYWYLYGCQIRIWKLLAKWKIFVYLDWRVYAFDWCKQCRSYWNCIEKIISDYFTDSKYTRPRSQQVSVALYI